MTNTDELDRLWRDALHSERERTPLGDPEPRVAVRVRRRRRRRTAATATSLAVVACITLAAVVAFTRHPSQVTVSHTAQAVVEVTDGPDLQIRFPGRATAGNPPRVDLPSGVIRFEIHAIGASRLVIDGVPGFVADLEYGGGNLTKEVRLKPGDYLMHSTIPGHAQAGEEAILHVQ